MKLDRYIVLPLDESWAVRLESSVLGTFQTKGEAIQAAVAVACSSGKFGNRAEVMTRGPDERFTPVWTYGLDGYSAEV